MDETVARARRKQAELRTELEKINKFLALYDELAERLGTEPEHPDTSRVSNHRVTNHPVKRRRKIRPQDIADAAWQTIKDSGRPMVRGDLAEAIETRGLKIPSKDKPRYIGTVLWRDTSRFVNLDGHGYWLRGVDYPEARYIAENDTEGLGTVSPTPEEQAEAEAGLREEMESDGRLE